MRKHEIIINNTDLRLRPSAVDNFSTCAYQWGKVFLEGITTIPSSRAAIGTGVHKAIETMWTDAIAHKKKDAYVDGMVDAGIESFDEEAKKGMQFNDGEDTDTCHKEIHIGVETWVDNLLPFIDIPNAVEQRFTMEIADHPLVKDLSGTVDYIGDGIIDDVKTSKRKPTPSGFKTQQSIYKILAEHNGHNITQSRIQGVVFTKVPQAMILDAVIDVDAAKASVNGILDTLEYVTKDLIPIELLLRPNPKHYLCSEKYCGLYGSCPATQVTKMTHKEPKL